MEVWRKARLERITIHYAQAANASPRCVSAPDIASSTLASVRPRVLSVDSCRFAVPREEPPRFGATRFELVTSCSQGRRANQAALRPACPSLHRMLSGSWRRRQVRVSRSIVFRVGPTVRLVVRLARLVNTLSAANLIFYRAAFMAGGLTSWRRSRSCGQRSSTPKSGSWVTSRTPSWASIIRFNNG